MPENWRQPEIRIVIYDKSQESTAKHLSDGDGGGADDTCGVTCTTQIKVRSLETCLHN